ncbi:hypothetical protein Tco_1414011, partial [Tanacetum coccineum]
MWACAPATQILRDMSPIMMSSTVFKAVKTNPTGICFNKLASSVRHVIQSTKAKKDGFHFQFTLFLSTSRMDTLPPTMPFGMPGGTENMSVLSSVRHNFSGIMSFIDSSTHTKMLKPSHSENRAKHIRLDIVVLPAMGRFGAVPTEAECHAVLGPSVQCPPASIITSGIVRGLCNGV